MSTKQTEQTIDLYGLMTDARKRIRDYTRRGMDALMTATNYYGHSETRLRHMDRMRYWDRVKAREHARYRVLNRLWVNGGCHV